MKTIKQEDDPGTSAFEGELERRLVILSRIEERDRRLSLADNLVLAAITIGSFVAVLIAQVL